MPRSVFKQIAKGSGWRSGDERPSGFRRLKEGLRQYKEIAAFRLSLLLPGRGGGISGRLISYGETLSDFMATLFGRVLVLTGSLTLVYFLLR